MEEAAKVVEAGDGRIYTAADAGIVIGTKRDLAAKIRALKSSPENGQNPENPELLSRS